jgi:transcription antitermination protein NusB
MELTFAPALNKIKFLLIGMITRRNIRIKAFQSIYSSIQNGDKQVTAIKSIQTYYNHSLQLLLAHLVVAKNICEYSLLDANFRKNKHLPTPEDLVVSTKAAHNKTIGSLMQNASFANLIEEYKIQSKWANQNIIKDLYNEVAVLDWYNNYINDNDASDFDFYKQVVFYIADNDEVQDMFDTLFMTYDDDIESVHIWLNGMTEKILNHTDFNTLISKDKKDFGIELCNTYFDKDEHTIELIKPKLVNWEVERIAKTDTIILQMGLGELLYFPNIPTKVSINEYIDIAKDYSTHQSGTFVNGVLDKIHKELIAEGRIHKIPQKNKS